MSEIDSIAGTQLNALLELVKQSREKHCREVLDNARAEADRIRRAARKQAREKISQTVRDERQRMNNEVRMAEAEIETEQRRRGRRRELALLKAGRKALAEALEARWQEPANRRLWAQGALIETATIVRSTTVRAREWTMEHPVDWAEEEIDPIVQYAQQHFQATVRPQPSEALGAGVRIRSQGVLIDMSIAGLLANEQTMEGELLAEFNRAVKEQTS